TSRSLSALSFILAPLRETLAVHAGGAMKRLKAQRELNQPVMTTSETHRVIEAVWRIESARLIAGLARIVRDVGLAEELAQDALLIALEQWPESGVPENPGAWLMTTAKHRAIDHLRRNKLLERKH